MRQRDKLLAELLDCRRFLMSQLADLADEEGREYEGKAWRWLRDNNKWPGVYSRRKKRPGHGWVYTQASRGLRTSRRGATSLPGILLRKKYIKRTVLDTEREALEAAVLALVRWYEWRDGRKK